VPKRKGEYLEGWQRAKSDLVNIRRKYEMEAQGAGRMSERNFAKKILPILDSFSMAISNRKNWEELPEEWRKGMENVHNQLIKVLKEYGVLPFSPLNEHFDPFFHEAVGTVKVDESREDNLVVEVIQEGYIMGEEVLRTAKVRVGEYKDKKEETEKGH
jgi:molecular chaperone GrpE